MSTPSLLRRAPAPLDSLPQERPSELVTDDLFLAAYALAEGADLVAIDLVVFAGKPVASFRLRARGVERLERAYLSGTAVTNVGTLKRYLKHLKDLLFARLRRERGP
jgi:hypothetical protein